MSPIINQMGVDDSAASGLGPQLEAGPLGRLRLDDNLRCWSVCWPPGRLGL